MLDNYFSKAEVRELQSWMEWAGNYVILTHMGPDGDAIGSSLAICHFLRGRGCNAKVIVPDCPPAFLMWLPGAQDIMVFENEKAAAAELIDKADVIFCLDFNTLGRIGCASASLMYSKARKIMVDHHLHPGPFCQEILSRPEACSTSELVFHLLCAMGMFNSITPEIAECIYTGMMTDTGGFTYNSSNSQIYHVIAQLIDKGIDKDEIYRKVFNNYTEDRLRLMGFVLKDKMRIMHDCSTALITLTDAEMRQYNFRKGDTEGFVNLPLQISNVKMSIFLREDVREGFIKLSVRSVGTVPCNRFAQDYFHGGGHLNASGGEFTGTMEEAVEVVMNGLDEWKQSDEDCIRQMFASV